MKHRAEFLVRRVDKVSEDAVENATILKRGDVVVVCPSPWEWSEAELTNPNWVIIKSDISMDDALAFISPQKGDARLEPALKLRAKSIDLDSIKLVLPKIEADKIDINHHEPIEISVSNLKSYSKVKEKNNPFQI